MFYFNRKAYSRISRLNAIIKFEVDNIRTLMVSHILKQTVGCHPGSSLVPSFINWLPSNQSAFNKLSASRSKFPKLPTSMYWITKEKLLLCFSNIYLLHWYFKHWYSICYFTCGPFVIISDPVQLPRTHTCGGSCFILVILSRTAHSFVLFFSSKISTFQYTPIQMISI